MLKSLGFRPSLGVNQQAVWGCQSRALAHAHHDDHHDDHHEEEHEEEHEHGPETTPTVFDRLVQITVVDLNGARHTVRGLEGKSLLTVRLAHLG